MTTATDKATKTPETRQHRDKRAMSSTASLAGKVRLPYKPTSFKLSELRRVVAAVKGTQG